ncbi:MAG: hypothetical protein ABFC57_05990 [Veillonellales bacterium]
MVLGLFSADKVVAKRQFDEYLNQECTDKFLDMKEEVSKMDEEDARILFAEMVRMQGEDKRRENAAMTEDMLKEFSGRTKLSIRQIAAITGLNKDKVNKMLRS